MAQQRKLVSSHAGSLVQDSAAGCKSWAWGLSTTPFSSLLIPPWQPCHVSLAPVKRSWSCSTQSLGTMGRNGRRGALPSPASGRAI